MVAVIFVDLSAPGFTPVFVTVDFTSAGLDVDFFSVVFVLAVAFFTSGASLAPLTAEAFLAVDGVLASTECFFNGFAASFFGATGSSGVPGSFVLVAEAIGAPASAGISDVGIAGGLSLGVVIARTPVTLLLECTCLSVYQMVMRFMSSDLTGC
ncbi:MAG: hypothetical protein B0W54_17080 [Cellvibrio sp. 79]|nr:MAG: hypothetical protein B0W54_17080 [Cellvibrio sp. 79]